MEYNHYHPLCIIKINIQADNIKNGIREIDQEFEKTNHHYGSIYTVDWSNTGRFIASGSNDKIVKIISVPSFQNQVILCFKVL